MNSAVVTIVYKFLSEHLFSNFLKDYLFIFSEKGKELEREGKKHQCAKRCIDWLPLICPQVGPGPQPRLVP